METIRIALKSRLVSLKMHQQVFRNLQQFKMEFALKCQTDCITSLRLVQNKFQLDSYLDIQLHTQLDMELHMELHMELDMDMDMETRIQHKMPSMQYIR